MKADFLRLECRIQRWNTTQPAVFLIDTTKSSLPTAVYNRDTFESMDSIRGLRPRPLKTHAYSFNRILGEGGEVIVERRATDGATANEFARRILEAAEPIDERAYHAELDRVIWPSQGMAEYGRLLDAKPSRVMKREMSDGLRGLDLIARRSRLPEERERLHFLQRSVGPMEDEYMAAKLMDAEFRSAEPMSADFMTEEHRPRAKKELLLELMDLISRLDEKGLEALLNLARTLAQD